ncbi:MAG: DUF72 domain-containing protein [Candidatus Helarchaeota archaeon]
MRELFIGCGGWQFFNVPGDKLSQYASVYNFVEVNRTFYGFPSRNQCLQWKKATKGKNFRFALKCNRQITHDNLLEPTEENFILMEKMIELCRDLDAVALVFQTPIFRLTDSKLRRIEDFFEQVRVDDVPFTWEIRGDLSSLPSSCLDALKNIFKTNSITHCTDFSRSIRPLHVADVAYTRIFGLGRKNMWQLSDPEIILLHKQLYSFLKDSTTVVSFHTQRMEIDAARLKTYHDSKSLMPTSTTIGLKAFMERIAEFDRFPISKKELLAAHGWKIFDLTMKLRPRMNQILDLLPRREYHSFEGIEKEVKNIISPSHD